MRIRML
jgi:hypothetical protein